jgi:hypothetical protein
LTQIRQELKGSETRWGHRRVPLGFEPDRPFTITFTVDQDYAPWQLDCLKRAEQSLNAEDNRIDLLGVNQGLSEVEIPRYIAFTRHLQELVDREMDPKSVLKAPYPCDQERVLGAVGKMLVNTMENCKGVVVRMVGDLASPRDWDRTGDADTGVPATPGFPTWQIGNLL